MLTVEYRLANDEERAILEVRAQPSREGCVDGCVRWFIVLAGGALVGLFGVVLVLSGISGISPFLHSWKAWLIAIYAILHCIAVVCHLRRDWAARCEQARVGQQDLADGRVQVLRCSVRRGVQMEDAHSPCWFLEVEPGKVLCLYGDYLYGDENDPPSSEPRPCRLFDLVKAPVSGQVMKMNCLDTPLTDWQTHGEFGQDEYVPDDGEVLEISLDTLHIDLKRLEQDKSQ